ncbi:MAG TPA: outer membrane protein assembly factor BamD, partial [Gemmatimonadales bacterium]|nr:outer membrane protein assembly factor BamD [Gemmatimonadales bacterium]
MQAMYLMVAAVVGMQQPVVPRVVAPALAHAQAALQGLDALDGLDGLDGLDALDALDGLDALGALDALDADGGQVLQDEQDPTDSLWRAARSALNRADYQTAASLYGDLAHRYPNASRAGDALYWAAFALYKNDNLDHARGLLFTQQQRYPKAATLRDGDALLARVQAALAKQGDRDAAEWIRRHAQPAADTGGPRAGSCPGEDDD